MESSVFSNNIRQRDVHVQVIRSGVRFDMGWFVGGWWLMDGQWKMFRDNLWPFNTQSDRAYFSDRIQRYYTLARLRSQKGKFQFNLGIRFHACREYLPDTSSSVRPYSVCGI